MGRQMKGQSRIKWAMIVCALIIFVGFIGAVSASSVNAQYLQGGGASAGGGSSSVGGSGSAGSGGSGSGGNDGGGGNNRPVAVNDSFRTLEDKTLRIKAPGVLRNDRDPDGNKLRVNLVRRTKHGKLTLRPNGSFVYKPKKNYNGRDTFVYKARDGKGGADKARVAIRVKGVNDRPIAKNDSYTTSEDRTLVVEAPGVLKNDKDVDGGKLKAKLVRRTMHGKLRLRPNGSFDYEPKKNFTGRDTFVYKARDGKGGRDKARVAIRVKGVNDRPIAENDSYTTSEDQTLVVDGPGVLENDKDVDGDDLEANLVRDTEHGKLTLRSDGSFDYEPDENFNGSDSFVYEARDGKGGTDEDTVTIEVKGVNDAPVNTLPDGPLSAFSGIDYPVEGVSVSDVDAGDQEIKVTLSIDHGTLTVNGASDVADNGTGSVTLTGTVSEINATFSKDDGLVYKSDSTFTGDDTLTVTTDDQGNKGSGGAKTDTDSVTINVTEPDPAPTVSSTTPADSATDVATDRNIAIEFSEGVDVTKDSFELKCPAPDAAKDFSLSGSGASYTLDPTNNLPAGTECQVRVIADRVTDTDTDDPFDKMKDNYTFTFTTAFAAEDDTYPQNVIGNVGIDSSRIPYSVTENDTLKDSTEISFFGWNGTSGVTEQGGEVSVVTSGANRGEFTYNPPAGYEGNDKFTYTIKDGATESTATGTIPVDGMIWFIDNEPDTSTASIGPAAADSGDGRLSNPFTTLAAYNTDAADETGDNIFLYETGTDYTGGTTLLNNQKLIGQDAGSGLSAITGLSEPSGSDDLPDMDTGAGDASSSSDLGGVTVGSDNDLHGFNVVPTSDTGISGDAFGTLKVRAVGVDTGSRALDLTNGTLDANFDGVSSGGGAKNVNLVNVGGDADLGGGTLSGSTDTAFDVEGGDADISYDGAITTQNRTVEVTGRTGGAVQFSGAIDDNGLGVNLQNNGGATINFSGSLDLDTGSNTAFNATGGGTINATGTGSDLDTTTATAVNIVNTNIGAGGVRFQSVSSVGGSSPGIVLDSTGTKGGFAVTGNGGNCESSVADCSGGEITGKTSNTDGILLTDTQQVSLRHMNVSNNTRNGLLGTRVNGFEVVQSRFTDNADAANPDEAGLHFIDSTGTALGGSHPTRFADVLVEDSYEHDVIVKNDLGTLAGLAVSSSNFRNDGASGQAGNRFFVDTGNTADVTVDVENSNFFGNRTTGATTALGFVGDAAGTSDLSLEVTGSNFDSNAVGLSASVSGGGDVDANYSNNTINDTEGNGINFFANASHTGVIEGTVTGNVVGTLGETGSGSAAGSGISSSSEGNGTMTLLIDGNTVQEMENFEGIFVNHALSSTTSGSTNATVTNNTIRETDFDRGLVVQLVSEGSMCADIRGNSFSNIAGTTDMRVRRTAGTYNIEQLRPTAATDPAELDDANNDATVTVTEQNGTINFGASNCATP